MFTSIWLPSLVSLFSFTQNNPWAASRKGVDCLRETECYNQCKLGARRRQRFSPVTILHSDNLDLSHCQFLDGTC